MKTAHFSGLHLRWFDMKNRGGLIRYFSVSAYLCQKKSTSACLGLIFFLFAFLLLTPPITSTLTFSNECAETIIALHLKKPSNYLKGVDSRPVILKLNRDWASKGGFHKEMFPQRHTRVNKRLLLALEKRVTYPKLN